MKSGNYDISVDQGSTFVFHLTYQDSAGTAIDLSSYSAHMQVRRSAIDTGLILDISSVGGVTGGGSTGEYTSGGSAAHNYSGITLNGNTLGQGPWRAFASGTGGIYIKVDADTMKNVPIGKHLYDLELTTGTDVNRVLRGRFEVEGEVTR